MMNHLRLLLALAATGMLALSASPRTKTTQSTLKNQSAKVEMLPWESNDSTSGIAPGDVTLRGYNKRASDAKETFFITNNTKHRISHVTLLLRYATLTGTMLHERTVTVPVRLRAGESQLVSIKSWDVQRLFYYYAGPKPRKMATPYKVAFRLTGYDIPVGK